MDLLGYASQSAYLLDNELLELAEKQLECARSEAERILTARAVKVLTLPGEMGERFQIMALGKGYDNGLRGFRTQDLTHRL
jgi:SAM-dependent MidA family methyltransferase